MYSNGISSTGSLLYMYCDTYEIELSLLLIFRAAFLCGREPNFEISEEVKQELLKFTWDEFLAMTQHTITTKSILSRSIIFFHIVLAPVCLEF